MAIKRTLSTVPNLSKVSKNRIRLSSQPATSFSPFPEIETELIVLSALKIQVSHFYGAKELYFQFQLPIQFPFEEIVTQFRGSRTVLIHKGRFSLLLNRCIFLPQTATKYSPSAEIEPLGKSSQSHRIPLRWPTRIGK